MATAAVVSVVLVALVVAVDADVVDAVPESSWARVIPADATIPIAEATTKQAAARKGAITEILGEGRKFMSRGPQAADFAAKARPYPRSTRGDAAAFRPIQRARYPTCPCGGGSVAMWLPRTLYDEPPW